MADIKLNFDALTLGDVEELEEYTGRSLQEVVATLAQVTKDNLPPAKMLTVGVWMLERSEGVKVSLAQVRQYPISRMQERFALIQEALPGNPSAEGGDVAGDADSSGTSPASATTSD